MLIEPPVSTTTVTPVVPEQAAALAGPAATTSPARARPEAAAAPARRTTNGRAGRRIRRAPPGGASSTQTARPPTTHEQQAEQGRGQQVGAGLRERAGGAPRRRCVDGSDPPAPSVGAPVEVGSTLDDGRGRRAGGRARRCGRHGVGPGGGHRRQRCAGQREERLCRRAAVDVDRGGLAAGGLLVVVGRLVIGDTATDRGGEVAAVLQAGQEGDRCARLRGIDRPRGRPGRPARWCWRSRPGWGC